MIRRAALAASCGLLLLWHFLNVIPECGVRCVQQQDRLAVRVVNALVSEASPPNHAEQVRVFDVAEYIQSLHLGGRHVQEFGLGNLEIAETNTFIDLPLRARANPHASDTAVFDWGRFNFSIEVADLMANSAGIQRGDALPIVSDSIVQGETNRRIVMVADLREMRVDGCQKWPLSASSNSSLFGSSGGTCLSSSSGERGVSHALPHVAQLQVEHNRLTKSAEEEKHRRVGENPRRYGQPPFVRRFLIALPFIPLGFGFALFGGRNLYNKRYGLGAALICVGWLLICCGAGIIMLSRWPVTWDWWI